MFYSFFFLLFVSLSLLKERKQARIHYDFLPLAKINFLPFSFSFCECWELFKVHVKTKIKITLDVCFKNLSDLPQQTFLLSHENCWCLKKEKEHSNFHRPHYFNCFWRRWWHQINGFKIWKIKKPRSSIKVKKPGS